MEAHDDHEAVGGPSVEVYQSLICLGKKDWGKWPTSWKILYIYIFDMDELLLMEELWRKSAGGEKVRDRENTANN